MQLIHKDTGRPVNIGDIVTSFRGEECTVTSIEEPRSPNSSGRVYVKHYKEGWRQGFYPSVFNLKWSEEDAVS